jgi:arylsulfatase A-like enzyme
VTSKPNVLWIVADHQIHATRPAGFDRFPLQRKLARLGTEFTRAYSVLPICSPARASMLTGLYPHAHGLTENDGRFGGRAGLEPGEWMVHHPFRDAGYRCGWFGKWHVDNRYSAPDYGFEGFSLPGYGYPYASEAYRDYLERSGLPEPVARVVITNESGMPSGTRFEPSHDRDWYDCVSGVAEFQGPVALHEASFVTTLAADWLDSIGDDSFFLRVDPWGPHPPCLLAAPFLGMLDGADLDLPANFDSDLQQRPEHHRRYRDYWRDAVGLDAETWRKQYQHALEHVIQVETALGALLERIDLDDTLVIFNSDHGDAIGSNGGVANKGDLMVEATMRIPLLMAGFGIAGGKTCDALASNLDLAPTLLDLCGLDARRDFHGVSLMDAGEVSAVRQREGFMAQHFGLVKPVVQRAWYRDRLKLVVGRDGFRELYDLERDPAESRNLALEARHGEEVRTMERELLARMQSVGDRDARIVGLLDGG